ncbi:MAG: hypothetical protein EXS14_00510 [Planctomycetes bacterium]|nr:hypothetical protein [Planctomycetota bacterium]
MELNAATGILTFRILISGPDGATKYRNLMGLREALPRGEAGEVSVMHASGDRVASFVHRPKAAQRRGFQCNFLLVAAPGAVGAPALDRLLTQSADAVVFLPRRDEPGGSATRSAWDLCIQDVRGGPRSDRVAIFAIDYCDVPDRAGTTGLYRADASVEVVPSPGDTERSMLEIYDKVRQEVLRRFDGLDRAELAKLEHTRTAHRPSQRIRRSVWIWGAAAFGLTGLSLLAWLAAGSL